MYHLLYLCVSCICVAAFECRVSMFACSRLQYHGVELRVLAFSAVGIVHSADRSECCTLYSCQVMPIVTSVACKACFKSTKLHFA